MIPRAPGAYNDLAIPIKLMEYLAYGRPLLVTDRTETARIVRAADAGIVVGDSPDEHGSGDPPARRREPGAARRMGRGGVGGGAAQRVVGASA